ncbi:MAG: hypothetical protein HYT07_02200 [Candidatus Levybacteria bacterium]|nr:hypothetical protein [Candidatus Levybacteria bacterium]
MKNEKIFTGFIILFFLLIFAKSLFAAPDYVLPYPDVMPGSKFYNIKLIWEKLSKYWYFGDFGGFKYNLKMSDKYIIEAKTLFEYKQYLLGLESLKKSDKFFKEIPGYLEQEKNENKDISQNIRMLRGASLKHIEVLEKLKKDSPEFFLWQPENSSQTELYLNNAFMDSINIRKGSL